MLSQQEEAPKRILIVDDEYAIRVLLKTFFESHQYVVRIAEDVETAFKIYCEFSPNLIISDIMMPTQNGLTLISRVRAIAPSIKVIYLSAWVDESETEQKLLHELLQYPSYRVVQKPFHLDSLLKVVREYLGE